MQYKELTDSQQTDMCQEYQQRYYPFRTIEDIDRAFSIVNPVINVLDNSFEVWEAHRTTFENELKTPSPPSVKPGGGDELMDRQFAEWHDIFQTISDWRMGRLNCSEIDLWVKLREKYHISRQPSVKPEREDEWKHFNGDYEKEMQDIKLHDGTIIEMCWPNAGLWMVCKPEQPGYTDKGIPVNEAAFVRPNKEFYHLDDPQPSPTEQEGDGQNPIEKWIDEYVEKFAAFRSKTQLAEGIAVAMYHKMMEVKALPDADRWIDDKAKELKGDRDLHYGGYRDLCQWLYSRLDVWQTRYASLQSQLSEAQTKAQEYRVVEELFLKYPSPKQQDNV